MEALKIGSQAALGTLATLFFVVVFLGGFISIITGLAAAGHPFWGVVGGVAYAAWGLSLGNYWLKNAG